MKKLYSPDWQAAASRVLNYELWVVAGLAAAGVIYPRLLPAVTAGAFFFWLARRLASGRWSARSPFDLPLGLLLLTIPVTLWATTSLEITLPQVWRLLAGAALFYAVVNWAATPARLAVAAFLFVLAGLVLALAAPFVVEWAQYKLAFFSPELYSRFGLLTNDPANPNVMAGCLALVLPVAAAFLIFPKTLWDAAGIERRWATLMRVVAGLSAALMLAVLVLTQSRSAWLACAVSLTVLALLRLAWARIAQPDARRLAWLVLAGLFLIGILIVGRIGLAAFAESLISASTPGSLADRVQVWQRAIYMIQDFPFTGIGMGTFTIVADRLYPFLTFPPGSVEHAHNLFLQVAVDLGLPGLVAWLAVLFLGIFSAMRAFVYAVDRTQRSPLAASLGAGLLASQTALIIHGLTDAVTWGMVRPAPLVWYVWGLAAALAAYGGRIGAQPADNSDAYRREAEVDA